jgi:hypothetical protein
MPRASKPKPQPEPTGPRLVRKSAPRRPAEPAGPAKVAHEQIALRAYELFIQEGFAHGHHLDHWLRAERELTGVAEVRPTTRVAGTRTRTR